VRFVLLAVLAMVVPLVHWIFRTTHDHPQMFNDFHDYWLASRLILEGHTPYDLGALRDMAHREGLSFVVGTGYSYLLPFAVVMIPFALLPFTTAVLTFNGLSLVLFGLTVAVWLRRLHPAATTWRQAIVAVAAGAYPPVYGTLANGQANLVVLAPFALGVLALVATPAVNRRHLTDLAGGIAIGLAGVVKLVPAAVLAPMTIGRRLTAVAGTVIGFVGSVALATLAVPYAARGSSGLADLVSPDPYFTNQSINGFVTRLVRDSDRTRAIWAGAFDAAIVSIVLAGLFGVLVLAALWRARDALTTREGLMLGMALTTVSAVIAAPKNAIWNEALVLVAVGLLVAAVSSDLRRSAFGRVDRLLLVGWLTGVVVQTYLWEEPQVLEGRPDAFITLIQSAALYGLVALWFLCARRMFRITRRAGVAIVASA
jgi:hypothetical protein